MAWFAGHRGLWLPLVLCLAGLAVADDTERVQRLALNPNQVVRIPVATDRLTTIRFPGPVSGLEAAFIATEPHPDARFLLSFRPGHEFFSLRALQRRATATLNVIWNRQTFVLELVESDQPWLSVVFEQPVSTTVAGSSRPAAPSRLFGLLDTARAYPLLKQQQPGAVAGVECVRPRRTHDYGDYAIRTEEVLRFNAEDTLVFRIALTNKTAAPLRYLPQSLMVRAGERAYFQSLTDATGLVPPHTELPVYFAVTGTADGSRNNLSPRNDFMVLLSRVAPDPGPAVTTAVPAATAPAASATTPAPPQLSARDEGGVFKDGIRQRPAPRHRPVPVTQGSSPPPPGAVARPSALTNAPARARFSPRLAFSISLTK